MADYYPLIARAVANLPQNTEAARGALYARARDALITELRRQIPALSEPEVTRERLLLEEAIRTIEREAARQKDVAEVLRQPGIAQREAPKPPTLRAGLAAGNLNADVRKAAVERATDHAVLARIATEDKDADVRKAAVERSTDQVLLARVATGDINADVRKAAVERVTDHALLVKIARIEDDWSRPVILHWDVRKAAMERLSNRTRWRIATTHKNPDARKAAVELLTDRGLLVRIATEDVDPDVRKAAVVRVTDHAVLARIAAEESNADVRQAAVERATGLILSEVHNANEIELAIQGGTSSTYDQGGDYEWDNSSWLIRQKNHLKRLRTEIDLSISRLMPLVVSDEAGDDALFKIVMSHAFMEVRHAALDRITNQAILISIARQSDDWRLRSSAIEKIVDQIALLEMARDDRLNALAANRLVALLVTKEIPEHVLLALATSHQETAVRLNAVAKLTDQTMLTNFASNDGESSIRKAAVERLADQALLAKIGLNDKEATVRTAAVERLTDQALLAEIASNDSEHFSVRSAAINTMDEAILYQTMFTKFTLNDREELLRNAAVRRLTDQALLTKIASNDRELSGVRVAAIEKITDEAVLLRISESEYKKPPMEQSYFVTSAISNGLYFIRQRLR